MMHLFTGFLVALVSIILWSLSDLTLNWMLATDIHTASLPTFMGMWWGVYTGLIWKKEDVST